VASELAWHDLMDIIQTNLGHSISADCNGAFVSELAQSKAREAFTIENDGHFFDDC